MGDTPEIPVNAADWTIDAMTELLQRLSPDTFAQLHWGIYLIVHSDEAVQANMTQWLWSWEWALAHDLRMDLLPGLSVTL